MGDVTVKKDASIWYNSVVRGDINHIIGERSNIQDGCILHLENTLPALSITTSPLGVMSTCMGVTLKNVA